MYGEKIKYFRKKKNLTQDKLGQKIGLSGVAIMRYEKEQRRPSKDIVEKMADVFGISPDDILENNIIGQNIHDIRKRKGFTQKELASKLGMSITGLQNYEYSDTIPSPKQIEKIAAALDVPLFEILGIEYSKEQILSMISTEELINEIVKRSMNNEN